MKIIRKNAIKSKGIRSGFDVNESDEEGFAPLYQAAYL